MDAIREIVTRLGYLFYVVSPSETTFQHITEIPNYVSDVKTRRDPFNTPCLTKFALTLTGLSMVLFTNIN